MEFKAYTLKNTQPITWAMDMISENIKIKLSESKIAPYLKALLAFWRCNPFINRIRTVFTNWLLPRKIKKLDEVKLHLGCGGIHLDEYINIDLNKNMATDYVADITKLLLPPASVDKIETYHFIEHLTEKQAQALLVKSFNALKPGGVLVIECPDLEETLREFLDGKQERVYNIYGRNHYPGDAHQFGYTPASMKKLLETIGFSTVILEDPTDYHRLEEPCLRVSAQK